MPRSKPDLKIHIGCSGWFYWHWRDTFYPPGVPTHKWFAHYAKKFKTVELNAPFYRWPTKSTIRTRRQGRVRLILRVTSPASFLCSICNVPSTFCAM